MKVEIVCVVVLLLAGAYSGSSTQSYNPVGVTINGATLYVGGSNPGNYTRIQDAIDNASDGDSVFVYAASAPYYENLIINVSICLIGEERNTTSIEGGKYAISIYKDGVTVTGFRISNVGDFWNCCGFYILSNGNNISNNNIVNNLRMNGVFLYGGSYNLISGNIIENNNYHGIRLEYTSNNIITDNRIVNNRGYGIYLWESTDNLIVRNTVKQSFWDGLLIGENSGGNTIFQNNFIENLLNAYDETGNCWDNGSAGNYWSDYTGSDSNGDGIGDLPYDVAGNVSQDRFPLMEPYGEEKPALVISINGGLGVMVSVKNVGLSNLMSVDWSVDLQGGLLVFPLQRSFRGTIASIAVGETVTIRPAGIFFGIGLMIVNVSVKQQNASVKGFLFLFFFMPSSV